MAETHVAPRPGAEDDGVLPAATTPQPEPEFDLPWRLDVPALRTLRIVRRELPPKPIVVRERTWQSWLGLDGHFVLPTRYRLSVVAVMSAVLGLAGSYGLNADGVAVAPVNPVADAHVIGAEHWQVAAPAAGTWLAAPTQLGRQDPGTSCAAGTLPADASAFRRSTASTGTGEQHVIRAGSPKAAKALIDSWLAGVRTCVRQAYGRDAQVRALGTYPGVRDGLTVVGVFYSLKRPGPFGTKHGAHLFAIGRDGRLLTTLELNVPGAPGRIPVGQFTAVAKRALAELR
jgi:hypothetical protein